MAVHWLPNVFARQCRLQPCWNHPAFSHETSTLTSDLRPDRSTRTTFREPRGLAIETHWIFTGTSAPPSVSGNWPAHSLSRTQGHFPWLWSLSKSAVDFDLYDERLSKLCLMVYNGVQGTSCTLALLACSDAKCRLLCQQRRTGYSNRLWLSRQTGPMSSGVTRNSGAPAEISK